ncbi:glutaminase, partial [Kitasatospora sp. NPDC059146]
MDYPVLLAAAEAAARATTGRGHVADYIPALAEADPEAFGMAVATVDGELHGVGDWERPFSIQSVSKLFSLALALAYSPDGGEDLWRGVGREPSGNPFNSLVQLETEHGIPRNPFINAGALVVTDRLQSLTGDASGAVRQFLRRESGNRLLDT